MRSWRKERAGKRQPNPNNYLWSPAGVSHWPNPTGNQRQGRPSMWPGKEYRGPTNKSQHSWVRYAGMIAKSVLVETLVILYTKYFLNLSTSELGSLPTGLADVLWSAMIHTRWVIRMVFTRKLQCLPWSFLFLEYWPKSETLSVRVQLIFWLHLLSLFLPYCVHCGHIYWSFFSI